MKNLIVKSILGLALTAGLVGVAVNPAMAITKPTPGAGQADKLTALQALAVTQTNARLDILNKGITKINANKYVDPTIKAKVLTNLNNDVTGITTLAAKIAADTDLATAKTDYKSLFTEYRVYAVVIPQSTYAVAASDITYGAVPKLTSAQTKLNTLLTTVDKSKMTPEIQAKLTDMSNQIETAKTTATSIPDTVLAITPADFNSNNQVLAASRANIKTASAAVKQATADGKAIMAAIK